MKNKLFFLIFISLMPLVAKAQGLLQVSNSASLSSGSETTHCVLVEDGDVILIPEVLHTSPVTDSFHGPSYQYLWIYENLTSIRTSNPVVSSSASLNRVYSVRIYDGPPPPDAMMVPETPELSQSEFDLLMDELDTLVDNSNFMDASGDLINLDYFHEQTCKNDKYQIIGVRAGGNLNKKDVLKLEYNSKIQTDGQEQQRMRWIYNDIIGLPSESVSQNQFRGDVIYKNELLIELDQLDSSGIFYLVFRTDQMPELAIPDTVSCSHNTNFTLLENGDQSSGSEIWNTFKTFEIVAAHDPNILSLKVCEFPNENNDFNVQSHIEFTNDGNKPYLGKVYVRVEFPSDYIAESISITNSYVPGMTCLDTSITADSLCLTFISNGEGFVPYKWSGKSADIRWEMLTKRGAQPCNLQPFFGVTSFGSKYHWKTNTAAPEVMEYCENRNDNVCASTRTCYSGLGILKYWWRKYFCCFPCE